MIEEDLTEQEESELYFKDSFFNFSVRMTYYGILFKNADFEVSE